MNVYDFVTEEKREKSEGMKSENVANVEFPRSLRTTHTTSKLHFAGTCFVPHFYVTLMCTENH